MLGGADAAGGAVIVFAGAGLGLRDHALDVLGIEFRRRHQHQRHGADLRGHIEALHGIIGQLLVERARHRMRIAQHQNRVTVLVRLRDRVGAERRARAGLVLDHEILTERLLQLLRDDAADDVGAAAGAIGHQKFDGARRPFLRACRRASRRKAQPRRCQYKPHCPIHTYPPGFLFVERPRCLAREA